MCDLRELLSFFVAATAAVVVVVGAGVFAQLPTATNTEYKDFPIRYAANI